MSGQSNELELKEDDLNLMLAASVQTGNKNVNFLMKQYVFGVHPEGNQIFKLKMVWEKILLAARAIVAVPNSTDVVAVGTRSSCQRACLKFAQYCKATAMAQRFTPGAFTNQIQSCYKEPRLLIVSDPTTDHQPLKEAAAVNIPVIAFVNSDTRLNYVDIAIPCNNKSPEAVGLMWWLLAREVLRIRGDLSRSKGWDVMVDMFISRVIPDEEHEDEDGMAMANEAHIDNNDEWQNDGPAGGMPAIGTMDAMANYGQTNTVGENWDNLDTHENGW